MPINDNDLSGLGASPFQCGHPLFADDLTNMHNKINTILEVLRNGIDGWNNPDIDIPNYSIHDGALWDGDTKIGDIEPQNQNQGLQILTSCPSSITTTVQPGTLTICQTDGHVYIYTGNQNHEGDNTPGWFDLGEGNWSNTGDGPYYGHVAYADHIEFSGGQIVSQRGFTTANNDSQKSYLWTGICVNSDINDPGYNLTSSSNPTDILNAVKAYKWNYMRGSDSNGLEFIYMLGKGNVKPEINQIQGIANGVTGSVVDHTSSTFSGPSYANLADVKTTDEFLPLIYNVGPSQNENEFYIENGKTAVWFDDPPTEVSSEWPVLYQAFRKKKDGVWGQFSGVMKLEEYVDLSNIGSGGGSAGTGTVLAFRAFTDQTAANTAYNSIKSNNSNPPSGWNNDNNITVESNQMLFMIYAYTQGGTVYDPSNSNPSIYWHGPYRIGSDGTTSGSGNDDDNFNYIYCRTADDSQNTINSIQPVGGADAIRTTWQNLVTQVENNHGSGFSIGSGNNIVEGTVGAANYWSDHPNGVTQNLPIEWMVGFTTSKSGNSTTYTYSFGPIIWSHWGRNGMDGDGYEYIFKAKGISEAVPVLPNGSNGTYNGRIGENGTEIQGVNISSTTYQTDDFIPTGWHDNYQNVSASNPVEYISVRKRKRGQNDEQAEWGHFSEPKVWGTYASDGFQATIDNDAIIFDDNSSSSSISYVSLTKVLLWNGSNEVTLDYDNVEVTIDYVGNSSDKSKFFPALVTSINNGIISTSDANTNKGWLTSIPIKTSGQLNNVLSNGYLGFTLVKSENEALTETNASIVYTIECWNSGEESKIASKTQSLSILDISDGVNYSLIVNPNTLGVYRADENSQYQLRNNTFGISAIQSSESGISNVPIVYGSSTASSGEFYVVVKDSSGNELSNTQITTSSASLGTVINCTLVEQQLTGIVTGASMKYLTVELYKKGSTDQIVDSETIDFSVTGDRGPTGYGEGTEPYLISGTNDNSIIDDTVTFTTNNGTTTISTTSNNIIKKGTINTLTVSKGNTNIINKCKFKLISTVFPTKTVNSQQVPILKLCSEDGSNNSDLNIGNDTTNKIFYIQPINLTEGDIIPPGYYSYTLEVWHDTSETSSPNWVNTGVTKQFNIKVLDISVDGSIYKLFIYEDVISYIDNGSNKTYDYGLPLIKAKKIGGNDNDNGWLTLAAKPHGWTQNQNYEVNDDLFYVEFIGKSDTGNEIDIYNKTSLIDSNKAIRVGSNNDNAMLIPYTKTGYDVELYKGRILVDAEHIDCRIEGTTGPSGYSYATVKLYKRFSSEYEDFTITGKLPTGNAQYNFDNRSCSFESGYNNGWTSGIPNYDSNNPYLYMTVATAANQDSTDTIEPSEWSTPIRIDENGNQLYNIRSIFLYRRSATALDNNDKPSNTLYYKFSNKKLYTNVACTSQYEYNGDWKLSPEAGNNALYEIHATAVSTGDIDEILTTEWSDIGALVNEIPDITQQPASIGKFYYYAGEWDSNEYYCLDNDYSIPYVSYGVDSNGKPKFYMLVKDTGDPADQNCVTGSENGPGGNNDYWEEFESSKSYYMAEAYFGNFAKFGSGIISGDFIISTNGYIFDSTSNWPLDGHQYNNGTNYNNKPAYTYFDSSNPDGNNITNLTSVKFAPNWWVNLKTGAMGAAQNKFQVDQDSNLTITGNVTANSFNTDGKRGNRIEISGGLFNVFNSSGQIGLSIGWDTDGNPFIFLTNGKSGTELQAYKLTYSGVSDASANITSDDATSTKKLISTSSGGPSAATLHTGPSLTSYHLYSASKSNVTGAYASTDPSNPSSSNVTWQNARKNCDGKLFTTSTISSILGSSSSYLIKDGYYISSIEVTEETGNRFSRLLYYYSNGIGSTVGKVRYKASGSTWYYCNSSWTNLGTINGQNHSIQFHPSDHLYDRDRSA